MRAPSSSETLCRLLVDVKHLYIQKLPETLSILEKQERVKALNDACNEILGGYTSDYYPH